MKTVIVWVLYLYHLNGPLVVDNIATKENCEALGQLIETANNDGRERSHCFAVRKAVP